MGKTRSIGTTRVPGVLCPSVAWCCTTSAVAVLLGGFTLFFMNSFLRGARVDHADGAQETLPSLRTTSRGKTGGSGLYRGYQYWNPNQTLATRTLVETPFARAQMHTVRLEDGRVVEDWLWFDEGDAINCLVQLAPMLVPSSANPRAAATAAPGKDARLQDKRGEEGGGGGGARYLVFEQRKYGYAGLSLAPVGGFVEPHETPLAAAQRELKEEAGITACAEWRHLGSYRVGANRGAGVSHTFLALGCTPPPPLFSSSGGAGVPPPPAGAPSFQRGGDVEAQRAVVLNERELKAALLAGRFKEVKWTATVALALLSLDQGHRQPP